MSFEEDAPWHFPWDSEDEEGVFEYLLSLGVIQECGIDPDDGEMMYNFNFEIMKSWFPEMYEEVMSGLNEKLMGLYEEGLVSVEYDETLKAHFSATEKGKLYFDEMDI